MPRKKCRLDSSVQAGRQLAQGGKERRKGVDELMETRMWAEKPIGLQPSFLVFASQSYLAVAVSLICVFCFCSVSFLSPFLTKYLYLVQFKVL